MQLLTVIVTRISRALDFAAGLMLAATAMLVVVNILGRVLLQRPILGTYEMVGYFTAGAVGMALAHCALVNSHIAVAFILDRFPARLQRAVEIVFGAPVFAFLIFTGYNLYLHGARIAASGQVSPTTQMIFYPFVYLVAIGFFALALVVLLKLLHLLWGGERP